jgi:hypothetical protein
MGCEEAKRGVAAGQGDAAACRLWAGASILGGWSREASGPMYVNTRPDMPEGSHDPPLRVTTPIPAHFQLEMERIHFDMWLCAGRAEQVSAPGRYFLRQVGNANVVVLGGEDGRVLRVPQRLPAPGHAALPLHRRASSRPHPMCVPRLDLRPGWTACLSAPHMDKVAGFAEAGLSAAAGGDRDLGRPHLHQSGERPRPFAEHLASLPAKFAPWGMADLRLAERRCLRAEGELEAHHPELLGVPALSDRATPS